MVKLGKDGVYIDPLSRAQRRQMKKNAARIDRISDADRKFFERFPSRKYRLRIAGQAEREQQALVNGPASQDCPPGIRLFVIVQNIAPGTRVKVFAKMRDDFETDPPERAVQALWEEATATEPRIRKMEAVMREVAGGRT